MTNSKVNHFLVNAQVPTRKVHGHEFPYYKILMDNGTPCDLLGNKPRTTSVLYMCNPRSSNEVRFRHDVTCLVDVSKAVLISLFWANHGGYLNLGTKVGGGKNKDFGIVSQMSSTIG